MPRKDPTAYTSVAVSNMTKADLQNFQRTLSYQHQTHYSVDEVINILLDYYIAIVLTNN